MYCPSFFCEIDDCENEGKLFHMKFFFLTGIKFVYKCYIWRILYTVSMPLVFTQLSGDKAGHRDIFCFKNSKLSLDLNFMCHKKFEISHS